MKTKNHSVPVPQNKEPANAKSQYRGADFSAEQNKKVASGNVTKESMKK